MKILDFEQGTPEWFAAKCGLPSGSGFHRLVTPTGKPSTQIEGYCNELVAEVLIGEKVTQFETYHTKRGQELEPQARAWFEFQTDMEVQEVGFVLHDNGTVGVSPDGLLPFGGLEIKCPKADNHIGYLRAGGIPRDYIAQVQGCMWVCERDTWSFVSFHPDLPELLVTVGRDTQYIKTLAAQVNKLTDMKGEALHALAKRAA